MSDCERGKQHLEGMPFTLRGRVIRGYGRGRKEIGVPTGLCVKAII